MYSATPTTSSDSEKKSTSKTGIGRALAVFGFACFDGNVRLTVDNFSEFRNLHLTDLDCERFVKTLTKDKRGERERIVKKVVGWKFKEFGLASNGVVFVPSTSGCQERTKGVQSNMFLYIYIDKWCQLLTFV